jgi:hypothetical protein
MATIDNLIQVTISNETAAVSLPSFGTPLILGTTDPGWDADDVVHSYSDPAGMLADGYKVDSPEYAAALAMCSGTISPATFLVGRRISANTPAQDLANVSGQNNTWYCVVLAEPSDDDILDLAPNVEGMKKILLVSSATASIATDATDDLASKLKAAGYNRTGVVFTANKNGIAEAAWVGSQLPQTPGSNTWAYKTLPGVTADALSQNQLSYLYGTPIAGVPGKNVNTYTTVGGTPVTYPGLMASGQYIDITIGIDWLQANIQTAIYALLSSTAKVPYTDAGGAMLMSVVRGVLAQAETNGLIDGKDADNPITVTMDSVDAVSRAQRAARIAPTIRFSCRLQGAMQSVRIAGVVTV